MVDGNKWRHEGKLSTTSSSRRCMSGWRASSRPCRPRSRPGTERVYSEYQHLWKNIHCHRAKVDIRYVPLSPLFPLPRLPFQGNSGPSRPAEADVQGKRGYAADYPTPTYCFEEVSAASQWGRCHTFGNMGQMVGL